MENLAKNISLAGHNFAIKSPLLCGCVTWGKSRKLRPVFTPVIISRHLSPAVYGMMYTACVHLAMLHGSKTWGPNTLDLKWLDHNDHFMICWICGTKDRDETFSVSLLQKLCIKDITAVPHSGQLRWYGHVKHATSCIKYVTDLPLQP